MALELASCSSLQHCLLLPPFRRFHRLTRFHLPISTPCFNNRPSCAPPTRLTSFRASMLPNSSLNSSMNTCDRIQHVLNISSRWIVAAIVAVVVVVRHDDMVFWAMTGSILNAASSKLLKKLFNQQRPATALGVKSDPGMPSSHAQSLAFLSLYASISLIRQSIISLVLFAMVFFSGLYLAFLRVSRGLHTPLQVMVGLGFGYCMAGVWIGLWHYLVKDIVSSMIAIHYLNVCLGGFSAICFLMFGIRKWRLGDA